MTEDPKKAFGDLKPGIHFAPMKTMLAVAKVMEGGAAKYGHKNWRETKIRSSTYYDAMFRHMIAWFEDKQDLDPDDGQHHLAHLIACAMLILDSIDKDILEDDR